MEIYRTVDGFENYAVSNLGSVKSLRTGRILKFDDSDRYGYLRVTFSKDGVTSRTSVHRLVATAFLANPENKPFINHKDVNPQNNHVDNLEWCTHSENMLYCVKMGRSTYSMAAKKTAEAKRARKEAILRAKLGTKFVSMNPGEQSTVTYLCDLCDVSCTVRLDSTALAKPRTVCKSCSYKFR